MVKIYRAGLSNGHGVQTITDTRTGSVTKSSRGKTTTSKLSEEQRSSFFGSGKGKDIRSIDNGGNLTKNTLRNLDITLGLGATRNQEDLMIKEIQDENLKILANQGQPAAQQLVDSGLSWSSGTMTPENINDLFPTETLQPSGINWKWILLGGAALLMLTKK